MRFHVLISERMDQYYSWRTLLNFSARDSMGESRNLRSHRRRRQQARLHDRGTPHLAPS